MDPDGDPAFHRSEAISAVQDDQYYGEDDDFDELYNDVNVGDGFFRNSHPPPPPPHQHAPPPQQNHQQQQQQQLPPPPAQLNHHHPHQQQQLPPPPLPQPQTQQPPPHSLPPPPPHAPPHQQAYAPAVAAPSPSQPPPQPNLPPPLPHPPSAPLPPPPQHHQIQQQGDGFHRPGGNYSGGPVVVANGAGVGGGDGPGGTMLFVGDLHWWTTDADLEAELSKYGPVKEVRFFDEKASGKSKGYCQVDFYDPAAAAACKQGMNGQSFHGRPCVVAFASPNTVRRLGEAQVRTQQALAAQTSAVQPKVGRGGGGAGMPHAGGNYSGGRGGGAVSGGGGGGNWGRGGGGGRGPVGNMRNNRMGPAVGRGIGNGMAVPPPPMMPQGGMLGQGFDPGFGAMGRMGGGFGNFPVGPGAGPFPGMMQPFPPVVAPHVNPAFFGRAGMGAGGVGMWPDPSMGAWGAEEQSNYGDDAASDHQYGEGGSHGKEKPPEREWSGAPERRRNREKDMPPEQEWPERRHRNEHDMGRERDRDYDRDRERDHARDRDRDRERGRDRERHRDDRDRYDDYHRHRDRDSERNEDWGRGRSSGIRSRSREAEHSKRRRMTPQ